MKSNNIVTFPGGEITIFRILRQKQKFQNFPEILKNCRILKNGSNTIKMVLNINFWLIWLKLKLNWLIRIIASTGEIFRLFLYKFVIFIFSEVTMGSNNAMVTNPGVKWQFLEFYEKNKNFNVRKNSEFQKTLKVWKISKNHKFWINDNFQNFTERIKILMFGKIQNFKKLWRFKKARKMQKILNKKKL